MPAIAPVLRIRAMIWSRSGCSSGSPPEIVMTEVPSLPRSSIRRNISSSGTGSETSSNSLQYVQARLHRRIGTMCAIYGCPVETSAEPIDASSRTLRVTAFQRRFALIGRLAIAVVEAEGIVTLKYIEPSRTHTQKRRPKGRRFLTSPTTHSIHLLPALRRGNPSLGRIRSRIHLPASRLQLPPQLRIRPKRLHPRHHLRHLSRVANRLHTPPRIRCHRIEPRP